MAENTRISTRSNHGCWTCRLRRKKCDETRPVCSACISFELMCHGYGSRPEWMDNGILQKDQASKFKRLVSQTRSKKGKRSQHPTSQPPLAPPIGMLLLSADNVSSPAAPSPAPVDQHLGAFSQDELHYQDSGMDFDYSIDPSWSLWPSNDNSVMESLFGSENDDVVSTTTQNQHSVQHLESPSFREGLPVSVAHLPPLHEASEMSSDIVRREDVQFISDMRIHSTTKESQGSVSHRDRRSPKEATTYDYVGPSSQVSSLSGGTEDALFMYYLDEVFYVQYPFYNSQNRQGRGWLFSILRRIKSAYHATLALSERHFLPTPLRNSDINTRLVQLRTHNGHYNLAIQGLQIMLKASETLNGRASLVSSLEILISLHQLLLFEISNGGREKWQEHLRTACSFIPILLQARMPPTMLSSINLDYTSDQPQNLTLHPEVDCAVNFLLGSFISFDIISSASTRSAPFLNIKHLHVLDILGISLDSIIGCRNSVMALILEISLLDKWKKEAQDANKLSVVDLATRGDQIQERLQQELAAIEKDLLAGSSSYTSSNITHLKISKIFVLSAVTYLHVVISGGYPEVPQIEKSVSDTIVAFKNLKDPRLIRSLVWPFCISGCLALDKHYDFFRGLVSSACITQWATGTCFEAFQIMEECWKARTTSTGCCEWTITMKSRGCSSFLR